MENYDVFISYATEDVDLATQLVLELKQNGLRVWFAEMSLKAGDKLLPSIEQGIEKSKFGVLLLSVHYLEKGWTNHEMDILMRQSIDKGKSFCRSGMVSLSSKLKESRLGLRVFGRLRIHRTFITLR